MQTEQIVTTTSPIKVVETAKSQQQVHSNSTTETAKNAQDETYRKDAAKIVQFIE